MDDEERRKVIRVLQETMSFWIGLQVRFELSGPGTSSLIWLARVVEVASQTERQLDAMAARYSDDPVLMGWITRTKSQVTMVKAMAQARIELLEGQLKDEKEKVNQELDEWIDHVEKYGPNGPFIPEDEIPD